MATVTRPRNIPIADVSLDTNISASLNAGQRTSMIPAELFPAEMFTTDERWGGSKTVLTIIDKGNKQRITVPKFLVESYTDDEQTKASGFLGVTQIGSYLIITPKCRRVGNIAITNAEDVKNVVIDDTTIADGGELLDKRGVASWLPDNVRTCYSIGNYFVEHRGVTDADRDIFADTMESTFRVHDNQPFVFGFKANDAITELMEANIASFYDGNEAPSNAPWAKGLNEDLRNGGGCAVIVGDFMFVCYTQTGTVDVFSTQVVEQQPNPEGEDTDYKPTYEYTLLGSCANHAPAPIFGTLTVTVYPIDNTLFVGIGTGIIGGGKVTVTPISISTETVRMTYSGNVTVHFWGGKSMFYFDQIVHASKVVISSPCIQIPRNGASLSQEETENMASNQANPSGDSSALPADASGGYLSIVCAGKIARQNNVLANKVEVSWAADNSKTQDYPEYINHVTITMEMQASSKPMEQQADNILAYAKITLSSKNVVSPENVAPGILQETTFYSPAILRADIIVLPDVQSVPLDPSPQISNADVLSISITESVENSSCQIVLNNRLPAPTRNYVQNGRYSYPLTGSNFCGVKPITVKLGYRGETTESSPITRFSGYVIERQYSRPNSSESLVTLVCQDRSKRLKETYAFNLPIYDGWCHLAVIYDLAKYAGLADNEILFYQNPVTGGNKITLAQLISSDSASQLGTRSGGCFAGHAVTGFPDVSLPGGGTSSLPNDYIHAKVSTSTEGSGLECQWMFQEGTPIWECMLRVREYTRWFLFVNSFGNLIYCPIQYYMDNTEQLTFKEYAGINDYNELQESLTVTQSTENMRNAVSLQGIIPVTMTRYLPQYQIGMVNVVDPGWPYNAQAPNYCPWLRWVIVRDPMQADPQRMEAKAKELYKRVSRNMRIVSFRTWGNPNIVPYQVIRVIERSGEAGVAESPDTGALFIVSNVQHQLTMGNYMYTTQVDAELYEPGQYNFGPLDLK